MTELVHVHGVDEQGRTVVPAYLRDDGFGMTIENGLRRVALDECDRQCICLRRLLDVAHVDQRDAMLRAGSRTLEQVGDGTAADRTALPLEPPLRRDITGQRRLERTRVTLTQQLAPLRPRELCVRQRTTTCDMDLVRALGLPDLEPVERMRSQRDEERLAGDAREL